jgi:AcrR family transcriptional regulator
MTRRSSSALDSTATAFFSPGEEGDSRADRFVAVAALQISEQGVAETSARTLAAAAGASPSAINYNFGSVERLLSRAFEHGAALTADWLVAREDELLALPRSPEGAVRALEHLLTQWTGAARPLALLYQEQLAAPGLGPAGWTALWRDFWLRIAAAFGLETIQGRLLHLFFESEALYHLSRWSPALEAAALRELTEHFGTVFLGAAPAAPLGALALAEQDARARPSDAAAPTAIRIMEAAAEVVEEGLSHLTHRSVAARAGLTTGAVTHYFRTVEDLVAAAIRGQMLAMDHSAIDGQAVVPVVERFPTAAALFAAARVPETTVQQDLGPTFRRRNLFLATVRRPDLASSGAVIRFAYGGNARDVLNRLFEIPPEMLSLHGGVLSRLLSSLWFACAVDAEPAAAQNALVSEIESRFMERLRRRNGG